ncbi:MAG TPA: hypothetical protein VKA54_05495 [Gemmatimonadaceae bacterium]|nr:hypothetical protein [Gemmatimonadaceae bacterium]
MRRVGRSLLVLAGIVVLSVPLTFVITIALLPVWSSIERRWGIESVGHSGPAEWCFWVVFAMCVVAICIIMLLVGARGPRGRPAVVRAGGGGETP